VVGIVIVSHSARLAAGVVELARVRAGCRELALIRRLRADFSRKREK